MDKLHHGSSSGGRSLDAKSVVQALPFPALLVGLDDEILADNRPAAALFGCRDAGWHGSFKELPISFQVAGLRSKVEDAKASGIPATLSDVRIRRAGGDTSCDFSVEPLRNGEGRVVAVLLTARDQGDLVEAQVSLEELRVTHADLLARQGIEGEELSTVNEELRLANEALHEQIRRLQEAELADERKNQFLAMLAHELRNPLGAIGNALYIVRKLAPADRAIQRAVRIADRQLRHEARLLDDLLDVSRIVVGKVRLHKEWLDLRTCVHSVVEGATFAVQAQALDLRVHAPDEPVGVIGDPTRLEQCVTNLLNNAIKFSPPAGRVTLEVRREDNRAVVTVIDSGVGIAPEMLERVFDLFSQVDATLARSRGGLGIGLTVVRSLVQLHGGTVVARSAGPGRGSEFEIRLPLAPGPPPAAPAAPAHDGRLRRILVVDDNRDAREMLRGVLEMEGHTVTDTGDGKEAIRLAVETAPEVILLDIGLPDLDGFEVASRIRARLGGDIRLVALSGYGDAESRAHARAAGFDAHLVKPVAPEELTRLLGSLFS